MYTITLYRICTYVWCVLYQIVLYNPHKLFYFLRETQKYRLTVCIVLDKIVSFVRSYFWKWQKLEWTVIKLKCSFGITVCYFKIILKVNIT